MRTDILFILVCVMVVRQRRIDYSNAISMGFFYTLLMSVGVDARAV